MYYVMEILRRMKMNSDLQLVLIVGGVAIVFIIITVLINKLLDYLSERFPIIYNSVLIILAVAAFILSFVYWRYKPYGPSMPAIVTQVLLYYTYMYLFLTDIDDSEYTTQEQSYDLIGRAEYYTDGTPVTHSEDHYTPAFVRKFGFAILGTAVLTLTTVFKNFSWIALILQLIMPVLIIINRILERIRRRRNKRNGN